MREREQRICRKHQRALIGGDWYVINKGTMATIRKAFLPEEIVEQACDTCALESKALQLKEMSEMTTASVDPRSFQ